MVSWELLLKYVSNECSDEEKVRIEEWIVKSPKNRLVIQQVEKIWLNARYKDTVEPDTSLLWQNIKARINNESAQDKSSARYFKRFLQIAALFIMVSGFIYWSVSNYTSDFTDVASGKNELKKITLPDESEVWLNKKSVIRYAKTFGKYDERKVYLAGEAYFNVKPGKKIFQVYTGKTVTQVLGTSFNVKNYASDSSVQVLLSSGKVLFYTEDNQNDKVYVLPGERVSYFRINHTITKSSDMDVNDLAWKTNEFIFKEATLSFVVQTLKRYYNKEILIGSKPIQNCRISATFDTKSLQQIVTVISLTLRIKYEVEGDKIIFKGEGCGTN